MTHKECIKIIRTVYPWWKYKLLLRNPWQYRAELMIFNRINGSIANYGISGNSQEDEFTKMARFATIRGRKL